jgi:hypothetical protein
MKITHFLLALAAISLNACCTAGRPYSGSAKSDPETVLVTYHVKAGKETEFETILSRVWQIYRTEHLVLAEPHVIVRATEEGGTRFVEILTWISHAAPEHAPESVQTLWRQEHALCETRSGHEGIEGGEVQLLAGDDD